MSMWDKIFETCKQEIENRLKECSKAEGKVFIVAIDGMCGSGKSTLGRHLKEVFQCSLFHMDDFFLQPHQRTSERMSEPGGNVDYERFKEEVLDCLRKREGLEFQRFDCGMQLLSEPEHIPYHPLVIIEGAYSCHPYFGDRQDIRFFLESSKERQRNRILERNGPEKLERFEKVWIPMEEKYFEAFQIKEKCICIRVDED